MAGSGTEDSGAGTSGSGGRTQGAAAFGTGDLGAGAMLAREGDTLFLEITLPEEMFGMETRQIDSSLLGMTRISGARFESPGGESLVLDRDLVGTARGERPVPGPLEGLCAGKNRVAVWRRPERSL